MADFYASLSDDTPVPGLQPALIALWWAYLHRVEGDLGNAGYWYRQAGQPAAKDSLDAEWQRIVSTLLASGKA